MNMNMNINVCLFTVCTVLYLWIGRNGTTVLCSRTQHIHIHTHIHSMCFRLIKHRLYDYFQSSSPFSRNWFFVTAFRLSCSSVAIHSFWMRIYVRSNNCENIHLFFFLFIFWYMSVCVSIAYSAINKPNDANKHLCACLLCFSLLA